MFIFNNHRQFNNDHHLVELHNCNMGRIPYHIYHYIVITYVFSGALHLLVEGIPITLKQDELIILDKYVPHSVLPTSKNDLGVNIILAEDFFDSAMLKPISTNNVLSSFFIELMSHQYTHSHFLRYSTKNLDIIRNSVKNILCETFDAQKHSGSIIDYYIIIILTALTRSTSFKTNLTFTNLDIQNLLNEIFQYIQKHFVEGNLTNMCNKLGYNSSYISKIIHQNTGKTFKQLVNDQRMNKAKILLQNSNLSISEIADTVGIYNQTNFYKRFKKLTKLTPNEFRKAFKSDNY